MVVLGLNEIENFHYINEYKNAKTKFYLTFFDNVVRDGLIRNTKRLGIRIHKSVNFQGRCKVVYIYKQHFSIFSQLGHIYLYILNILFKYL